MDEAKDEEEAKAKSAASVPGAKRAEFPSYFPPMLASLAENAFSGSGWIYEPKMDGMRCIAFVDGKKVKLLSRRGQNITTQYPALSQALPELCRGRVVLDGEIIALNDQGRPSFQLLQKRMNLLKVSDISKAEERIPVHFFVFDIVYAIDCNLARCTLMERKKLLNEVLQPSHQVILLNHFESDGRLAYEACVENGFEGIVAKRKESIYEVGRRSPYWVKVKAQKSSEFVIGGYSQGEGGRSGTFGSMVLGYYDDNGKLIYAGSVGTGLDGTMLEDMLRRMNNIRIDRCPFEKVPSDKRNSSWCRPELVAEIKFMDFTDEFHIRNPVFLHLRHDIAASEVRLIRPREIDPQQPVVVVYDNKTKNLLVAEAQPPAMEKQADQQTPGTAGGSPASTDPSRNTDLLASAAPSSELLSRLKPQVKELDLEIQQWQVESQSVIDQLSGREKNMRLTVDQATFNLSNLDKTLFPATSSSAAISKREFLQLIAFLSPYLLTHIAHRPLTMIRAPSGMRSRSFYQKHWNLDIPDFIETIRTELEDPSRKDQLLCNNVAALIFLAQHNILEYHCWMSSMPRGDERLHSNAGDVELNKLALPDYMTFDLDFHKEGEKETDDLDKDAFQKTREAAFKLKETLLQLGLSPFLKTSGRNGLHIFIPIALELIFEEVRSLAETIARHLETHNLDLISTNAVLARKAGKVYLDYTENTRGRTLAAPYSPRLTPQATISTPIEWKELETILPVDFNQRSIRERLISKKDIWKDILEKRVKLSERFNRKAQS